MSYREQALIPGLPDDISFECLVRVPHRYHSGLRPVCRRWRNIVTSPTFRRHRERIGAAEDIVLFVQQAIIPKEDTCDAAAVDEETKEGNKSGGGAANCRPPSYSLCMYNATMDSWHRVPAAAVPMFAQCAVVGEKLVLVGGWDPETFEPVADVRVLDLATGEWRRGAPMAAARSFFACAAAEGGRVYVAGGHDGQKNALRSAEAYDVEADEWAALPPMAEERDECQGVAAGGRFWAVSGYSTERQGMFDMSAECYDPATGEWSKEEEMLGGSGAPAAAFIAVGEERVWRVERREVREYDGGRGWQAVATAPEGVVVASPCAAAMGGGERVFVMGGDGSGGGYAAWVVEAGSGRWTKVGTPAGFSGFVYSAAALRL